MTWSLSPPYWIQRLKSINEMTSFLIEIMFGTSWWICMDMDVDAWLTLWARALTSAFSQCLLCPSSLSPGLCSMLPGTNSVMLRSWINIKIIKIIKSWKVWRVAFRQVVRIGESAKVWWKYSSWIFFGWSHWGIAEAISFMSCMYVHFEMFRTSAQSLFPCLFSQSFSTIAKSVFVSWTHGREKPVRATPCECGGIWRFFREPLPVKGCGKMCHFLEGRKISAC